MLAVGSKFSSATLSMTLARFPPRVASLFSGGSPLSSSRVRCRRTANRYSLGVGGGREEREEEEGRGRRGGEEKEGIY